MWDGAQQLSQDEYGPPMRAAHAWGVVPRPMEPMHSLKLMAACSRRRLVCPTHAVCDSVLVDGWGAEF